MRFLPTWAGVSYSVVLHLRKQAHDVVHLRDEGLQRLSDEDIVGRAANEQRIVLTFDLDFAELAFNSRSVFPSVVIYRLTDQRPHRQIERLMAVLLVATQALESGAIVIVDDARVRVRELPVR